MNAARITHPPLSGGDRKHFRRQLDIAEQAYKSATRGATAAHAAADRELARAHRFDCKAWSAPQFIGGPEDPSPSIVDAIHGGCELLEVQCRHCNHADMVDLTELIWPREKPVHSLRGLLYCTPCRRHYGKKRRPDLVGLRMRDIPGPAAPAAA
jgi:hypothetical protein